MSDNNPSARKRKADGNDPSPRGKKLGTDLLATLEDPDLCDVTLVGSDEGRVPAIRVYLSARSDVLKHLLVGQFKEASEEEVRMDYPAAVLKAVVHFCCTDDVPDLSALDADIVESMRLAIKLVDAADYYDLGELKKKAKQDVGKLINTENVKMRGSCLFSAFEEASRKPSLEGLYKALFLKVVSCAEVLTTGDRPGVTLLSSTNLRNLVKSPVLRARALLLYQAIKIWRDNSAPIDEETFESDEDRRNFAEQLASNLELRMMQPSDLLGPVSDSGLVAQDKIIQALQIQSHRGMLGIYGCFITYFGQGEFNGVYDEIPVNGNFEVVAKDDPTRVLCHRRFEKRGKPGTEELNLTIISFFKGTGAAALAAAATGADFQGAGIQQYFWLLAPPVGAGNLVLTGNVKTIAEDNRLLYVGERLANKIAKPDGTDVKWRASASSNDVVKHTKKLPRLVIGPTLLSAPSVSPTEWSS